MLKSINQQNDDPDCFENDSFVRFDLPAVLIEVVLRTGTDEPGSKEDRNGQGAVLARRYEFTTWRWQTESSLSSKYV